MYFVIFFASSDNLLLHLVSLGTPQFESLQQTWKKKSKDALRWNALEQDSKTQTAPVAQQRTSSWKRAYIIS